MAYHRLLRIMATKRGHEFRIARHLDSKLSSQPFLVFSLVKNVDIKENGA